MTEAVLVVLCGWGAFAVCAAVARSVAQTPVVHQTVLKALLALVSLALVAVWRKRTPGAYGFERAVGVRWRKVIAVGMALGACASFTVLLLGGRGMQAVIGSMKLWQIVLTIWFGSSIAEELFTRGWAQGALEPWKGVRFGRFSLPVLTGAFLFGSMHVLLFFRGVDVVTATVIVCASTVLGLWAGELRERHRGLAPAIGVHISFNAGGMAGGIVYVVLYRLLTGRLPFTS